MISTLRRLSMLITVASLLILTSCGFGFDHASFKLSDGTIVQVDRDSLEEFEVGQKVWLIRSYAPAILTDWEILSDYTIGQIGFEPTRDTTFVFHSHGGDYRRRIALGTLIKKY